MGLAGGGRSRANLVLKPNLTWLKNSQIEVEYYYRVITLFLCLDVVTGNCNPLAPFCISKPENASTVFSAMRFESLLLSKAPPPACYCKMQKVPNLCTLRFNRGEKRPLLQHYGNTGFLCCEKKL